MSSEFDICERRCDCKLTTHSTGFVVVTGGPGAGKTAILEMAKKHFCQHIVVLPEAASIVFGGGFWRLNSIEGRAAAQRAIFHIQREMENLIVSDKKWALALCDRGTLDGLAYWPLAEDQFWQAVQSSHQVEMDRYAAVIHLRTPTLHHGYNHQNVLRIETAEEARRIDEKIEAIWSKHPGYVQIPSSKSFIEKARTALVHIRDAIPECCRLNGINGSTSS
jgi:predicted ATPase